jgi:hypothetical protein
MGWGVLYLPVGGNVSNWEHYIGGDGQSWEQGIHWQNDVYIPSQSLKSNIVGSRKLLVPFFCNELYFIPCSAAGISISDSDSGLPMHHCNQASYWHLWASCFGCTFTNLCNSSIAQDACAEYIITSNASLSQTINQFTNQMASLTNHIHITPAPVTKATCTECKVETFSALTQIECNVR